MPFGTIIFVVVWAQHRTVFDAKGPPQVLFIGRIGEVNVRKVLEADIQTAGEILGVERVLLWES